MEINPARYAALLADAAFLHQVRDALEHERSDAETISAIWAIIKDAEQIRSAVGAVK